MTIPPSRYRDIADAVLARYGRPGSGAAALADWLGLPYRAGPGGYDLAGPAHDEPPRTPRRSLVLAATYRSGSTVVAEALGQVGGHGLPLEYFQAGSRYRRFPDRPALLRHRTDATGTFGVKLFWPDVDPAAPTGGLPDPLVVRIRRSDHVAQAVSTLRALQTGRWRSTDPAPAGTARYDPAALWQLVGMFADQDRLWDRRLPRDIVVTDVEYADLRADPARAIAGILAALRHRGRESLRPPTTPRQRPLTAAGPDPWVPRFVADVAAGRAPGPGAPVR